MRRRKFIQRTLTGTAGTVLLPGLLRGAGKAGDAATGMKRLVVIRLSGGNDSLNMVVPYTDPLYYRARPALAVPADEVLRAGDTLGFNPVMKGIADLYRDEKVTIINNVGYPHPNRSHFRSMDIWETASDAGTYLHTGWLGRWLDTLPPAQQQPYMAIEDDEQLSLALKGKKLTGIAVHNPKKMYDTLQRGFFRPLTETGRKSNKDNPALDYIRKVMHDTVASADYIWNKTKETFSHPQAPSGKGRLKEKLETIALMMEAGLATPVYYTSLDGFDTHVRQKEQQERLLKEYSEGVTSFVRQLEKNGLLDNTLIFTFSEFGRRVAENASGGTDHGCAASILLISGSLKKPGVYNEPPDLAHLDQGDLRYTIDFRSVYATLLQEWLDADAEKILGRKFQVLKVV